MRQAQVLVYESDGRLADLLREPSQTHGFRLRTLRHPKACLSALCRGGSGVFILRLGRDLEREFTLLEQITRLFPDSATIVVGDGQIGHLAGYAWDLGARFVLIPPMPVDWLRELVPGLLRRERATP